MLRTKLIWGLFLVACAMLCSCASKPDPEVEFRPLQLSWNALSPEAEAHPSKDACVIKITAQLMRESVVLQSKKENLDYRVSYGISGENLEFKGILADDSLAGAPEYGWTSTCGSDEKVVVKFHNGL